jgi:hypothetical protein
MPNHKVDSSILAPERLLREGELVDWEQVVVVAQWLASVIAPGVISNLATDLLKSGIAGYFQRKGGQKTLALAVAVLTELRAASPYEPEEVLKTRVTKAFAQADFDLTAGDLPASPPEARPVVRPPRGSPLVYSADEYDFFIAYSSADRIAALSLFDRLEARGRRVFLDVKSVRVGSDWMRMIPDSLKRSRAMILLITENNDGGWFFEEEIIHAVWLKRRDEITLLPVHLGARPSDPTTIPYGLGKVQSLSMAEVGSLEELAKILDEAVP